MFYHQSFDTYYLQMLEQIRTIWLVCEVWKQSDWLNAIFLAE